MRRAAKVDANHAEVVAALRQIGCRVQDLSGVGGGCPDLLVGWRGRLVLIEVKDGRKPPSARALTRDQVEWHQRWQGLPVRVATGPLEAVAVMSELCGPSFDALLESF